MSPELNIHVRETAISGEDGETTIFLPPDSSWYGLFARLNLNDLPSFLNISSWTPHRVPCATLDTFIESNRIQRVALCKLDLEGQEPAALQGAHRCLTSGALESLIVEVVDENREALAAEIARYRFEIMQDLHSLRLLRHFLQAKSGGATNVLLARGECAKRWKDLGWSRWLV